MKPELKKKAIMLSETWLKGNISNSMVAITVGYYISENIRLLKYILYYRNEEQKQTDEEIIDEISGEVLAQMWQDIDKIEINAIFYSEETVLTKLDAWLYVEPGVQF
jgi:hypothetical protein